MNFKKQGIYLGALLLMWCFTLAAKDPEKANKEKTPLLKSM
ncbi:MAG: hypothetical protein HW374_1122, partial [Bacteroidetes bacterium]|nr:hypothetical protein [Bacteroidota bacterium]